ncbi:MYO9B family protein [Megaselia abdita]
MQSSSAMGGGSGSSAQKSTKDTTSSTSDTSRYILQVYVGALSLHYEALSVEASKQTSAEEIVSCIVERLGLRGSNYELAEVAGESKERRLGPHEKPVSVMLLWSMHTDRDFHRFYLRESQSETTWLDSYGLDTHIWRDFMPFLLQPGSKEYPDLCQLPDLNEQTLLENLKIRFDGGHIYTYVGSILIACNPFKFYAIYNPKYVRLYQNQKKGPTLPPHIFAIADNAYYSMLKEKRNQCIVISGESGSGKTESTNFLLHHLTALSQKGSHGCGVEQTILSAGPVLEAFGNAKTAHNNNSSRFGKFIQVNYRENGMVQGAVVQKYLLEKSRIVSQGQYERNYHVFYYLLSGATDLEREQLHLLPADKYKYLNAKNLTLENCDEKYEFSRLKQSMEMVGFSPEKQRRLFNVLSAVLLIGNVEFFPKKSTYHHDESVQVRNLEVVNIISELLKVKQDTLLAAMTSKRVKASGETLIMQYKLPEAIAARDALAKCLYGALFDWIVLQVNHALLNKDQTLHTGNSIGVLDIFGFEDFGVQNSFEQLCINYANEHLQYYFNLHVFKYEQNEYKREGIKWSDIEFTDNHGCLQLFESKPTGLLCILDDLCNFPGGTNEALLQKFNSIHNNTKFYEKPQRKEGAFIIRHYAGKVKYQVHDMREKNLDLMRQDIVSVLKNSSMSFVRELVGADPVAVFRWAIIRAFFRSYFAFRNAGVKHRKERTDYALNKYSGNKRFSRSSHSDMILSHLVTVSSVNLTINRIAKNKSFRPRERPKKGLKNLQTVKMMTAGTNLLNQTGIKTRKQPLTVTAQFQVSLNALMDTLNQANPYFIRCIKSNAQKIPNKFDETTVLRQLRYTGMLETVRIRRAGYNVRLTYEEFIQLYRILLPKGLLSSQKDVKDFLLTMNLNRQHYQTGITKIYMRESEKLLLDTKLHRKIIGSIITIQRWFRGILQRNRFLMYKTSAVTLQSYWRMYLTKKKLQVERVSVNAAIIIQSAWRMYKQKSWYKKLKKGVVMFQAHVRGYVTREKIKQHKQKLQRERNQLKSTQSLPVNRSPIEILKPMEDSLNNSSKKVSLQRPHYSLDSKYSSSSLYDDNEKLYSNKKPPLSASTSSNLSRLSSSISSVVIDNTTSPYYYSSSSSSPTSLLDKHQTNESLRNLMISGTGHSATATTTSSSSSLSTPTTTTIPMSYSNSSNSSNSNKMHLYQSHKDSNGSSSRNSSSYSYDSENSSLLTSTSSPIKRQPPVQQSEVNKLPIRRTDSTSGIQTQTQTVVDASALLKQRPSIDNQKATSGEYQFHPIMKSMSDSVSPSDIIAGHHYQQHGKYVKRIGSAGNETVKQQSPSSSYTTPTKLSYHQLDDNESNFLTSPKMPSKAAVLLGSISEDHPNYIRPSKGLSQSATKPRRTKNLNDPNDNRLVVDFSPSPQIPARAKSTDTLRRRNSDPSTISTPISAIVPPAGKVSMLDVNRGNDLYTSSTNINIAGHRFRKVARIGKAERCGSCQESDAFVNEGYRCVDCKALVHTKCIQNGGVKSLLCEVVKRSKRLRKSSDKVLTPNSKYSGTREYTDSADRIICDAKELNQMNEFITQKIYKMEEGRGVDKDSDIDKVFKKALRQFKDNLLTQYSVANKQNSESLNIKYRDLIDNFVQVMETCCDKEKNENFPLTMGVNAFRGFLNEFMNSREAERPKAGKRKKEKKRKIEEHTNYNGHTFQLTIINIPTACEICSLFLLWPIERGLVCQNCRLTCHKKCYQKTQHCNKISSTSGGGTPSSLSSSHPLITGHQTCDSKLFGVPLTNLCQAEGRSIPLQIEQLISKIEMLALYTEGIYRKSSVASKIKELKQKMSDEVQIDYESYNVHVLTNVLKTFLRDMPEPLLTFDRYDDFLRASDLPDTNVRVQTIMSLIKKLPTAHHALLERLIFHLALVARREKHNRMSASSLSIVFAPCVLRTNRMVPAQDSLNDITRQTKCIETLITQKMLNVESTLADIDTLDTAAHTATTRLSTLRSSKVFTQDEMGVAASRSGSSEGKESSVTEEMLLEGHIQEIKKEKALLTSVLPNLVRTSSDDDLLSTDLEGEGGSLDDLSTGKDSHHSLAEIKDADTSFSSLPPKSYNFMDTDDANDSVALSYNLLEQNIDYLPLPNDHKHYTSTPSAGRWSSSLALNSSSTSPKPLAFRSMSSGGDTTIVHVTGPTPSRQNKKNFNKKQGSLDDEQVMMV